MKTLKTPIFNLFQKLRVNKKFKDMSRIICYMIYIIFDLNIK